MISSPCISFMERVAGVTLLLTENQRQKIKQCSFPSIHPSKTLLLTPLLTFCIFFCLPTVGLPEKKKVLLYHQFYSCSISTTSRCLLICLSFAQFLSPSSPLSHCDSLLAYFLLIGNFILFHFLQ